MNDPIVESLNYRLKLSEDISFDNPPPLEEELPSFKLKLNAGILEIEMKDFFSSERQARASVEPFLKAWELDNFLDRGHKEFWFEFINSKIVDRNPPPADDSKVIKAEVGELLITGHSITVHITRKNYPSPPTKLLCTPDVESLLKRYEGFLQGSEPLISMAYFCLSLLQSSADGRGKASIKYNINKTVLDKLGELTSERGDKTEARKLDKFSTLISLTDTERTWIRETIKLIIRRKAEYDFDPTATFPFIKLNSLPTL